MFRVLAFTFIHSGSGRAEVFNAYWHAPYALSRVGALLRPFFLLTTEGWHTDRTLESRLGEHGSDDCDICVVRFIT